MRPASFDTARASAECPPLRLSVRARTDLRSAAAAAASSTDVAIVVATEALKPDGARCRVGERAKSLAAMFIRMMTSWLLFWPSVSR